MNNNKNDLLSFIQDKDMYLTMSKLIDKINLAQKREINQCTKFLNTAEQYYAKSILNRFNDITYTMKGGHINYERAVIIIGSPYFQFENLDSIMMLKSNYISENITHRDVLGTIMSLGVKREMIGDIIISENIIHIFVCCEIADYMAENLNLIKKQGVSFTKHDIADDLIFNEEYIHDKIQISSFRLDSIIKSLLNISRNDANSLIKSEKVKLNHQIISNNSVLIKIGDLISIKGYGRIKIDSNEGITRKGNIYIAISKYN